MENFTENAQTLDQSEITKEELRTYENDILAGVLAAANTMQDETETIVIKREGKIFFKFSIAPITEELVKEIKERNTRYRKNGYGIKVVDEFNDLRFRSEIIYQCTVKEDREKIWNNPDVKKALNCLSGVDVIDRTLKAGEKDRVYDRVQAICGFADEDVTVEAIKNL